MGKLLDNIVSAIRADNFVVSWQADERCEEIGITAWQLVAKIDDADLVRERPRSKPNPSVVLRQVLADGSGVEAIWAWLAESKRAMLVTVYFRDLVEQREKRKRWVQRGEYAVEVEVEAVFPTEHPSEACLEPATLRWLDEVARKAEEGDIRFLRQAGRVFQVVPS